MKFNRTVLYNVLILWSLNFSGFSVPEVFAAKFKVGDKAPDFTLSDPSGNPISLSSFQGRLVLLDFWTSWCGSCKVANEEFIPIYNKYKSEGFEIFSVSLDDKKEAWINGIKKQRLPWSKHASDLKGWESQAAVLYGVEVLPSTFLIDEKGIIIEMDLDEYDLEKKLTWFYNEQIRFYPQTVSSKLFFTGKSKYEILDSKGSVVLKGKDETVDVSKLPAGEFSLKYEGKSEVFTKKDFSGQTPATFTPTKVTEKITLSRDAEYEVYNQQGRLIKQGKDSIIDLSAVKAGTYYLFLEGAIHSFEKK